LYAFEPGVGLTRNFVLGGYDISQIMNGITWLLSPATNDFPNYYPDVWMTSVEYFSLNLAGSVTNVSTTETAAQFSNSYQYIGVNSQTWQNIVNAFGLQG
jgi:hypothetical protein